MEAPNYPVQLLHTPYDRIIGQPHYFDHLNGEIE